MLQCGLPVSIIHSGFGSSAVPKHSSRIFVIASYMRRAFGHGHELTLPPHRRNLLASLKQCHPNHWKHMLCFIESRTPSPAISDVFFMSIPSKCQRATQSGLYRSVSQSTITVSGLSPHVSVHWPTGQPWTDADQIDWEAG
ncbi:hypothetical protein AZE42_13556 [Rhizopogon vesiculosus]|uniref:Uncharacterized protein n=1 Tax=Rhizopogon vesiculosus TaxID=180088 RepID=A0A1J8PYE8_9AGAM|nr:hypothetical protein AZE42_13556 [Rhizopogon vesiculosus]